MATITAFKFDTPDGAEQMLDLVKDLSKQQLITLQDAAIVTWPQGKKKPKTHQLESLTGAGALSGAFWGMLFGLIFFIPFFGMAIGAAMGALVGKFSDYGIDDSFIKSVSQKVTAGTSALFLMTSGAVMDKVTDAVKAKGLQFEILSTNLSKAQEDQLRQDFGAEEYDTNVQGLLLQATPGPLVRLNRPNNLRHHFHGIIPNHNPGFSAMDETLKTGAPSHSCGMRGSGGYCSHIHWLRWYLKIGELTYGNEM